MTGLISAAVTGNLERAMHAEVKAVSAGLRRATVSAAGQVQKQLRQQARNAGFRGDGKRIANAWRVNVYPKAALTTLRPAALIWTKAPDIIAAFDSGQTIHAKHGKYLAWPTAYNATGGKRGGAGGMRITPQQMIGAQSFVITSKHNPRVKLWCLRAREGRRGRTQRLAVVVRAGTYVATGHGKGRAQRMRDILARGFVPMFFLEREVTPGKRLNVEKVRAQAPGLLVSAMVRFLAR
jgi:hypothetical protein